MAGRAAGERSLVVGEVRGSGAREIFADSRASLQFNGWRKNRRRTERLGSLGPEGVSGGETKVSMAASEQAGGKPQSDGQGPFLFLSRWLKEVRLFSSRLYAFPEDGALSQHG